MSVVLGSIGRDLRYALRGLTRRPAFTIAAVLTLAIGIGATTAIFSVVYSVLLKPLPYPNADELVRLRYSSATLNTDDLSSTPTQYFTYRAESRTIAQIGLWGDGGETVTTTDGTERIRSLRVTDGLLQALGVQPVRGRWFTEQEHGPVVEGADPIIVSYGYAQSRYGGDEAALGRDLVVNGRPAQIVGIMPAGFRFLNMSPPFEIMVPMRLNPATATIGGLVFPALARLKPGVTPQQASADIERMLPLWLEAWPMSQGSTVTREAIANWRITPIVRPLKDDIVGGIASALWVLMGAIGAVLLIACANIANLMLVRADARRPELAMRAALGARPSRIARELLIESLVLGAAGGGLGLLLAYVGLQGLIAIGPSDLPRLQEIAVHPPVLAFAVAVSLASTLVFGSITALKHALQIDTHVIGAGRGASASRERNATRSALVVVQVAFALVLVVSAGLMIRSFQALRDIDPGFSDPATIQTATIWIPGWPNVDPGAALSWTRTQHEILDKITALPGVASAGFVNGLPIEHAGNNNFNGYAVEGQTLAAEERPQGPFKFVSPGYFEAMGTRLIAGRDMTWTDIEAGGRVVVVSADFARQLATEPAAALGQRIRFVGDEQGAWREVIGVTQGVHERGLYEDPPAMVYWPAYMSALSPDEPENASPVVTF